MKKVLLVLVVVGMLGACTASAEAGWRYRWGVRRPFVAPVVVRPRVVAPVVVRRPVFVAPPVHVVRPVVPFFGPAVVPVRSFYGGGVHVQSPGFGLHISY